jgi:hypothetical protein
MNSSRKSLLALFVSSCLLALPPRAAAQTIVFTEDWEIDHSLDNTYVTNFTASGVSLADLHFDYNTVGIPLSPNSTGTSTRALKMAANLASGATFPIGVSVSPLGFSITENFELRFDAWFNFNGPLPLGGSGSTQVGGAGYGTAGTAAQTPSTVAGVVDSVFIGGTTDGNSSADYRVYSPAHYVSYQDGVYRIGSSLDGSVKGDPNSGFVYAAEDGTRNVVPGSSTGYYATNFPGQTVPLTQYNLYPQQTNSSGVPPNAPGTAHNGALAFKWRDVSLKKVANTITYAIDGVLIATVDVLDAGALGGANILFNHYDINAGASGDVNRTNLIFTLIDNVRVTEYTNVVSISATTAEIVEGGPNPGVFTLTRSAAGTPLTVNYTVGGLAANGVDYTNGLGGALAGAITFAPADFSTNISVLSIDDAVPELTETVTLSITPSLNYVGAGSATATIADNETPQLTITNLSSQLYERTNDLAAFRITRLGDTNAAAFTANLAFAGAAVLGTDFYTNGDLTIEPGVQSANFSVYPIADAAHEGNEAVTAHIAAASGGQYTIGSPDSASVTLVDANVAPETILFAENFNSDHSANWSVFFVATNGPADYIADFNFPYTTFGIPEAPHGGGNGLFLNVNKDSTGAAAAVNLYPIGQSFSGNFALRFDLFLSVPLPSASATEHALAGINHSGTKTNWWRSGGVPAGWTFDGLFFALETDNQSSPNYAAYSSPTTAANNPTLLGSQSAANLVGAFKSPPWGVAGTPGNINNPSGVFGTPIWADVEISQLGGIVTLRINNTTIFSLSNPTAYASGNMLIGYLDAFDSVSPGQSYAVFDNLRIVRLEGLAITPASLLDAGADIQFDLTFGLNDSPASFQVQSAPAVAGPYASAAATIVQLTPNAYRATVPKGGEARYYRVRHQ